LKEKLSDSEAAGAANPKLGGEILVRIDLGRENQFGPFLFFFLFPVNCFTLTLDSVPSFDKKWCPVPQVWGPVWMITP
jgi:hypothetical protein